MAKGKMYVDGICVPFDGEKNVLAVIRKAGIDMPTFCYPELCPPRQQSTGHAGL